MTVGLYLILLKIQSCQMKKFYCSILAVMMKCIENSGLWYRLFLSAIVKGDRRFGISRKVRSPLTPFSQPRAIAFLE